MEETPKCVGSVWGHLCDESLTSNLCRIVIKWICYVYTVGTVVNRCYLQLPLYSRLYINGYVRAENNATDMDHCLVVLMDDHTLPVHFNSLWWKCYLGIAATGMYGFRKWPSSKGNRVSDSCLQHQMVEKVFERVFELIRVFSFYFTVRDKWELNPFMDSFS